MSGIVFELSFEIAHVILVVPGLLILIAVTSVYPSLVQILLLHLNSPLDSIMIANA